MLTQALVLLSQEDTDAPALPGIATVSKSESWDDGGYSLGLAAVQRGAVWVDRPFFTGNPSVDWLVQKADRVTAAGGFCQIGNEQNLVLEGWQGGPTAWHVYQQEVRAAAEHPERCLAMPPSPGVPGWEEWVSPNGPYAVHAYGSFEQMRSIVAWYLDTTDDDVYVTECNFGAGNEVAVDQWATHELIPFLDYCATEPRVKMCAYFAWRWRGAPPMPTPVDAAGTAVETVLRTWRPPEPPPVPPEEGFVADVPLSTPTRISPAFYQSEQEGNYSKTPRARTIGVVIHSTGGGSSSYANEAVATVNWFQARESGVSAHRVIGPAWTAACVPDDLTAYHARENNRDHLGLEFAVPDTPQFSQSAWPAVYYEAGGELLARWAITYAFPLRWVASQTEPGLIEHSASEAGRRDGRRDPTGKFDAGRLLQEAQRWHAELTGGGTVPPTPPTDVTALQDKTWAACENLQALSAGWQAAGWPSTGAGIAAAAEAAKSLVRSSKKEQ